MGNGKGKDNEGGKGNTLSSKNGAKGQDNESGNGKSGGGKNGANGKGKGGKGGIFSVPNTFGGKNAAKGKGTGGKGGLIIPLIDDTDCAHLVKNLDHEGITSDLAYQMVMEDFPWMDDEESEVQNTFWPNQNNVGILVPKVIGVVTCLVIIASLQ